MVLQASLRMFHDLELVRVFQLDRAVLARWLLTVKKNYRPEVRRLWTKWLHDNETVLTNWPQVVYHNWRHAFMVAQAMYSALAASGWWRNLGPVTCLGLLVACLCHDIDHRGQQHDAALSEATFLFSKPPPQLMCTLSLLRVLFSSEL